MRRCARCVRLRAFPYARASEGSVSNLQALSSTRVPEQPHEHLWRNIVALNAPYVRGKNDAPQSLMERSGNVAGARLYLAVP